MGDCANTVIDTERDQLPNILFVGLSYTNALEIMSIYNFNEMHSIDPRHYEGNLSEYIRDHNFDYVVVVRNDLTENNPHFTCTLFDDWGLYKWSFPVIYFCSYFYLLLLASILQLAKNIKMFGC